MTTVRLRWECPEKDRYYEAHLSRDLFGDWVLTRVWGRRGSPRGQVLHTPCGNREQARELLARTARRREAHGYHLT